MHRTLTFLLVNDNPADVRLFHQALHDATVPVALQVFPTGSDVLRYLRRLTLQPSAARPDGVIVKVKLPGLTGWEILAALQVAPTLATVPVMVLSEGDSPYNAAQWALLRPALYCIQPLGLEAYAAMVQTMLQLCLTQRDQGAKSTRHCPLCSAGLLSTWQ